MLRQPTTTASKTPRLAANPTATTKILHGSQLTQLKLQKYRNARAPRFGNARHKFRLNVLKRLQRPHTARSRPIGPVGSIGRSKSSEIRQEIPVANSKTQHFGPQPTNHNSFFETTQPTQLQLDCWRRAASQLNHNQIQGRREGWAQLQLSN